MTLTTEINGKDDRIGLLALQPGHTLSAPASPGRVVRIYAHYCQCCGKLYFARRRTGTKYCSATCRKRASNGHKTWITTRRCQHCGRTYQVSQPHQYHQYCSNACRQAAYRQRKRQERGY